MRTRDFIVKTRQEGTLTECKTMSSHIKYSNMYHKVNPAYWRGFYICIQSYVEFTVWERVCVCSRLLRVKVEPGVFPSIFNCIPVLNSKKMFSCYIVISMITTWSFSLKFHNMKFQSFSLNMPFFFITAWCVLSSNSTFSQMNSTLVTSNNKLLLIVM